MNLNSEKLRMNVFAYMQTHVYVCIDKCVCIYVDTCIHIYLLMAFKHTALDGVNCGVSTAEERYES